MKNQTFGIEVETTGLGREKTARAIAAYFGTQARYVGLEDSAGRILYENTDAFQKEGIAELMDKTVCYRESLDRMQKTKTDRSVLMAQSCLIELIEMYHQFMTTKEQP